LRGEAKVGRGSLAAEAQRYIAMSLNLRTRFPIVLTALYLVVVFACIPLAFDFAGAINFNWTLVLIGLTLPWSLVSVLFAWSLIHGAGLEFFTVMYVLFAGLNATILYYICFAFRRYYQNRNA
jgi:hypothetical protein